MNVGHAAELLKLSNASTNRLYSWIEAQKRPYAKLMIGFLPTVAVVGNLPLELDYTSLFSASKVCKGAVFTFGTYDSYSKDSEFFGAIDHLMLDIKNLQGYNCPVILPWHHSYNFNENGDKKEGSDLYLFMPFQKPNESFGHETIGMPPQPRTLPNFEGQVTFLAYLMRKGYVTEADAPRGEDPKAPFSAAMFGFAKTRAQELSL